VGALRDALFKFLFARHMGGANILRIEDTDRSRYSEASEAEFIKSLKWVGISYDEGPHMGGPNAPYRQSERKEAGVYAPWIKQLLEAGHAYKAFETPEELEDMRTYQQVNKQPIGYFGGVWREATSEQVAEAEASGKPFVVRQRIPRDTTIVIEDVIRGRIEWNSNDVDDPVLIKADGMPTYHFASMVDDHLMEITHIMRGEEWISSAPKHAALFDSFGWERPIFVHCPVIKGNDGKKLSKRHGSTRVLDYKAHGFLPAALLNFVALIGWSPGGDLELMELNELIRHFELEGLQPSPGLFDFEKLKWMNGHYIRETDLEELTHLLEEYLADPEIRTYWTTPDEETGELPGDISYLETLQNGLTKDRDYAKQAIALEQERVQTLFQFGEATAFFLVDDPRMDAKSVEKWFTQPHVGPLVDTLLAALDGKQIMSVAECEALVRDYAETNGYEKLGPVVHPIRVALTGKTVGPGLFELMSVLGPDRMRYRLQRAKGMLS
jgi:glutamyl-tRNA synthetase